MNIWLLTTEFPPFFGGGISTYFKNTAQMLSDEGHKVTVILPDGSIDQEINIQQNHYRVVRFKAGAHPIYKTLGYMAALSYQFADVIEKLIKSEGQPDLIESQEYSGIAYFLLHRKKQLDPVFRDIRVVICLHTPKFITDNINQNPIYKFPNAWIEQMERYCILAADYVLSPSEFLLKYLKEKYKFQIENHKVIPNPYQVPQLTIRESVLNDEIIFFGRVQYLKGLDRLLSSLSTVWDTGFNAPIRIIGGDSFFAPKNTSYKSLLEKKFKKYIQKGLIHFDGLLHPEEAHQKMLDAKVVIVPSLFESFSYAVVEAMSLGKLVLTTTSGGQSEIIQSGINGFTYDLNNTEELVSKITYIFNEMTDTEIIKMGERAHDRVKKLCSLENIHLEKIKAYQLLMTTNKEDNIYPFVNPVPSSNTDQDFIDMENESYVEGLLTIVVPYFNMGNWISETLESLDCSKYKNMEIIVVNDGSNEAESLQQLELMKDKYPIRIINKKNGGLASARNVGAKAARGEFLAFLDADDKVHEDYYVRAIDILRQYQNVSFVGCWAQYFEESQNIWPTWDPEPPLFLVHNSVNSSALVYKTKSFVQYGLNDSEMVYGMEDYESAVRMVSNNCRGVMLTHTFFYYRIRKGQMSSHFNVENQNYLIRLITEKNKDIYSMYAGEILNILNNNGPGYLYDNPTWELPPINFVQSASDIQIRVDSNELPYEVKQKLLELWQNKTFKRLIKLVFKLKIDRMFK